ncbi:hypothetical protein QWZ10_19505 [Paracoccus cavernae]|uniref:Uncharacterized protein n=1 Tax=Paracoccus cavernae TaxID=1571207 RepID=A0ABT8D9B8_9RHOB|nr:hypothetical protein [Paracoccus cavernae]
MRITTPYPTSHSFEGAITATIGHEAEYILTHSETREHIADCSYCGGAPMTTTPTPAARVSGTIKALEWKANGLRHATALGFNTTYTIMLLPDGSGARWQSRYMGEWFDAADSEAAKAAAQSDYRARILAAIQPDPEPKPVAWRYDDLSPYARSSALILERRGTGVHRDPKEFKETPSTPPRPARAW